MIVADTNLIAYLLLSEERAAVAQGVHARDDDWVAPPLWQSEFRNVLVLHVRQGLFDAGTAREAWGLACDLVREDAAGPLRVLDVALDRGLSAYDAEFVALAEALGAPLVTEDRQVLASCGDLAISAVDFAGGAASRTEG